MANPLMRRVGGSLLILNDEATSFEFVRFGLIPGPDQTVPRSDLNAVIDGMGFLPKNLKVHFVVDASYVPRIAHEIVQAAGDDGNAPGHACLYCCNGGLWNKFQRFGVNDEKQVSR